MRLGNGGLEAARHYISEQKQAISAFSVSACGMMPSRPSIILVTKLSYQPCEEGAGWWCNTFVTPNLVTAATPSTLACLKCPPSQFVRNVNIIV